MIRRFALLAAAASVVALAACGQPADQKAEVPADGGFINLYTARHYSSDEQIYAAFTKATGIQVRKIEVPAEQLVQRLKAEGAGSPADVVVIQDAGAMGRVADANLLTAFDDKTIDDRVPEQWRDPQGRWFGIARRARVVAYDSTKVKPEEVDDYAKLASPRFKGKLCVRNSDNSYNLSLMAALIERWGPERALQWARGIVANMARPPEGADTEQIKAVGAGQCEVAITNHYYYLRMAESDDAATKAVTDKVKLAFPSLEGRGAHFNLSGAGLAANAPNRANAIKFLEFLTGPEAQSIFASATNEFPTVLSTTVPQDVGQFMSVKADPLPLHAYSTHLAASQRIFEQAGWR